LSETGQTPDSHDIGKLAKWYEGLVSSKEDAFPVCALFVTSGEDRKAHDIFRAYRSAFEEIGAGFHDLVIFGQHGTSSTCTALLPALGLSGLRIPSLVLIRREKGRGLHATSLPEGALADGRQEQAMVGGPWRQALEMIKQSVAGDSELALDGLDGLKWVDFPGDTLVEIIGEVKSSIESD
jgi:hypothetical protein